MGFLLYYIMRFNKRSKFFEKMIINKQIILLNRPRCEIYICSERFYSVYLDSTLLSIIDHSFQYSILSNRKGTLWTNHARIKLQPRFISTKFESQLQYSYPTSNVFAMCKQRETQKHILTTGSSF